MTHDEPMSGRERRAALSLALIFLLRMLGLFMIFPVFALYATELEGATPVLVGLAVGVYGLTQALLQMPFGALSDRVGRKPVIVGGLLLFALGSVVAAAAESMFWVIVGRALQGSGAIAATVMALAADLTREEHRLKAMAIIGISIGLSFSLALVIGPALAAWVGVPGLFWLTAVLAVLGIAVVVYVVPTPAASAFHRDAQAVPAQFRQVIGHSELLRLDFGIFVLHMILTATFVVLPLVLRDAAGLAAERHWIVYLLVMLVAMGAMVPFIIQAEKKRRMKQVLLAAVIMIAVSQFALATVYSSLAALVVVLLGFFVGFNVLEAILPSLIAKTAPPDKKGTAMGVYSSSQFFGAFCGGAVGGWLYGVGGAGVVFVFGGLSALLWALIAATMKNPRYLTSHMIRVGSVGPEEAKALTAQLTAVRGVAEAVVGEDGVAYLKVDNHALDREALKKFSKSPEKPVYT